MSTPSSAKIDFNKKLHTVMIYDRPYQLSPELYREYLSFVAQGVNPSPDFYSRMEKESKDRYELQTARRYPEAKDFGRITDFDQYKKEVVAAVKKARKALESEAGLDSTRLPRGPQHRASNTSRSLISQLQGILTRDYQDLNIQVKQGVNSIPQVVYKMGERTFYADIMVPQERFNTRTMNEVMDRIADLAKAAELQDYEDQDGIHYTKKGRKDRRHFGFMEKMITKYSKKTEAAPVSYDSKPAREEDDTNLPNPPTSAKARLDVIKDLQKAPKKTVESVMKKYGLPAVKSLYVKEECTPEAEEEFREPAKEEQVKESVAVPAKKKFQSLMSGDAFRKPMQESVGRAFISFNASKLEPLGSNKYKATGDITIESQQGGSTEEQNVDLGVLTFDIPDDIKVEYEGMAKDVGGVFAPEFTDASTDSMLLPAEDQQGGMPGVVVPRNAYLNVGFKWGGTAGMEEFSGWSWEPSVAVRALYDSAADTREEISFGEAESWMENLAPIPFLQNMREQAAAVVPYRTDLK